MALRPSPHPSPSRRLWIAAIAVPVLIGAAVWYRGRQAPPVHYTTAAVSRGDVAKAVTASGTVNPMVTVQVGSDVSGVIESVSCDFNTRVAKGQVCARIDPRPYQTIVDQDRANVEAARAQLEKDRTNERYASVSYQRDLDLLRKGIISQDAVDQARSTADQARAQVDVDQTSIAQHQAALKAAEVNLGYTNIVSPVDGIVVSRNVTTGQTVAASFQTPTLFLIATDLTHMEVDTNVSESDIGDVRGGERASFTVEAFPDRTFDGSVTQVRQAPQTVQNVVTYDVVVGVANPQDLLKPGMTATVHVITDERRDVVRVPDQALRFTPGGLSATAGRAEVKPVGTSGQRGGAGGSVWVLRDGKPVRVAVRVGLDDGANAEIAGGAIQPGDRVIVSEQGGGRGAAGQARSGPRLRF